MRLLLPITILLLLSTALLGQDSKTVKTDKIEGIICTNVADWKFMVKAKEFWTPRKEDVLKAEEKIEDHLRNNTVGHAPDLWRRLPDYQRQYVGIVIDGRKRIFCNFLCSKQKPLTARPVLVFDGGECFFTIVYDLGDQKCYNFKTSGSG